MREKRCQGSVFRARPEQAGTRRGSRGNSRNRLCTHGSAPSAADTSRRSRRRSTGACSTRSAYTQPSAPNGSTNDSDAYISTGVPSPKATATPTATRRRTPSSRTSQYTLATIASDTSVMKATTPARPHSANGTSHSSGPPMLCSGSGRPSGPGETCGSSGSG